MSLYDLTTVKEDASKAKAMPQPTGYRLLLALPEMKKETDGKILLPDVMTGREQTAAVVAFVVSVGPDAYSDKTRFPNGPWCKAGDWVVVRSYSGTRIKIHGKEFRFVNDDTIDAVIDDPRGVERAA